MTPAGEPPARIPLVPKDTDDEVVSAVFAQVRQSWGHVPNLYRTLGWSPTILEQWINFAWTLRNDAVSDRALRELSIMRTAQLNGADYEWRHHWQMALTAGVTEDKLQRLARWDEDDAFSPQERAVLAMTDQLAGDLTVDEEAWTELRRHFAEQEVMELVLTASFYACVSRFLRAMHVPVEPDFATVPPVPPVPSAPPVPLKQ